MNGSEPLLSICVSMGNLGVQVSVRLFVRPCYAYVHASIHHSD